ncbi:MAG: class B sortase [Lachnospiraceae bacterium]|nr:class B sortase [Candidatus Colinaster equi]
MNEMELVIRGRHFRTKNDYALGYRDNRKIEQIENSVDLTKLDEVSKLRSELEKGQYRFESLVGEDFIDEIIELEQTLRSQAEATKNTKNSSHNGYGRFNKSVNNKSANDKKGKSAKNKSSLDDFDEEMKKEVLHQMKVNQIKRRVILAILAACILGSVGYLVFYFALYEKNDFEYNSLAALKKNDAGGTVHINYTQENDAPPILKKYETLYNKNKKIVGWITIKGCNIDYPVMQTNNNEYYLDHNYQQDYDKNGSIFMDMNCTPAFPNDNMILYGHHMKSGKMFGNLNYYAKQDFYSQNPTFTFDTIYEEGEYAVMYVFRSRIYSEEEIVFKYYQFIDAMSEDEFNSNMNEMAELSLYDTGVSATYGDKLITLSTCDSSEPDGRFVVVAKKIR